MLSICNTEIPKPLSIDWCLIWPVRSPYAHPAACNSQWEKIHHLFHPLTSEPLIGLTDDVANENSNPWMYNLTQMGWCRCFRFLEHSGDKLRMFFFSRVWYPLWHSGISSLSVILIFSLCPECLPRFVVIYSLLLFSKEKEQEERICCCCYCFRTLAASSTSFHLGLFSHRLWESRTISEGIQTHKHTHTQRLFSVKVKLG